MADEDDGWLGAPSSSEWPVEGDPPRQVLIRADAPDPDERTPLLEAWRRLPPFPFLLVQVGVGAESAVQFAAIDWRRPT